VSRKEHLPECPTGRHHDDLCICDLLRTVRNAARAEREEREEERRENRLPE
jgi:hypothetical protein